MPSYTPLGPRGETTCYDGDDVGVYDWYATDSHGNPLRGWCSWFVNARLTYIKGGKQPMLNGNGWYDWAINNGAYRDYPQAGFLAGRRGGADNNHIAFIEYIDGNGNPVFSQNFSWGGLPIGQQTWWCGNGFNAGSPTYYVDVGIGEGPGPGPTPPTPQGHWEKEDEPGSIQVTLTPCDSNINPSVPDYQEIVSLLAREGIIITDNEQFRDPRGKFNKYTYERKIYYPNNSSGYWRDEDWSQLPETEEFIQDWSD